MIRVLDTDIFIDFLRGHPPSQEFFETLENNTVLFSAVTEAELLSGKDCTDEQTRKRTLDLLERFGKIEVTNAVAQKTGELRRVHKVDIMDAFIAATALLNHASLITRNLKDFQQIKELKTILPY